MRRGVYEGPYRGTDAMAGSCAGGKTRGCDAGAGACAFCHKQWGTREATSRAAGVVVATRPAGSSVLSRDALYGDAEPVGLVDEVVCDARAWERDDALGE